jgi:hypothetical protein
MRYFVIGDDGKRYGPADLEALNQWIQEGRLLPTTLLEEEGSGARIAAQAVQGLNFPAAAAAPGPQTGPGAAPGAGPGGYVPPMSAPTAGPYASYQRPIEQPGGDGQTEMIISWVLGGLSLVLCCCWGWILAIPGAWLGSRANSKGNRAGQAAMIFNIVILVIGIVWIILAQTVMRPWAEQMQQQLLRQQQQQKQMQVPPFPGAGTSTGVGPGTGQ